MEKCEHNAVLHVAKEHGLDNTLVYTLQIRGLEQA